jgi:hypothetical protein
MAFEKDIANHVAARKKAADDEARRLAQSNDLEAQQRLQFAEAKRRVIIPTFARAQEALAAGGIASSWEDGDEERQGTGQMLRHSFARFLVAGEHVIFEWISYRSKVRIFASRALNKSGNPSNDTESHIGLEELVPECVEDHLLRTIRQAVR